MIPDVAPGTANLICRFDAYLVAALWNGRVALGPVVEIADGERGAQRGESTLGARAEAPRRRGSGAEPDGDARGRPRRGQRCVRSGLSSRIRRILLDEGTVVPSRSGRVPECPDAA